MMMMMIMIQKIMAHATKTLQQPPNIFSNIALTHQTFVPNIHFFNENVSDWERG